MPAVWAFWHQPASAGWRNSVRPAPRSLPEMRRGFDDAGVRDAARQEWFVPEIATAEGVQTKRRHRRATNRRDRSGWCSSGKNLEPCQRGVVRERYIRRESAAALCQRPLANHLRASPWRSVARLIQVGALTELLATATRHMARATYTQTQMPSQPRSQRSAPDSLAARVGDGKPSGRHSPSDSVARGASRNDRRFQKANDTARRFPRPHQSPSDERAVLGRIMIAGSQAAGVSRGEGLGSVGPEDEATARERLEPAMSFASRWIGDPDQLPDLQPSGSSNDAAAGCADAAAVARKPRDEQEDKAHCRRRRRHLDGLAAVLTAPRCIRA